MQCDYRLNAVFMARCQHSPVMIELRERKLTLLRFDAGPFDGKSISVEPETSEQRYVFAVTMIVIASIARRLRIDSAVDVFQQPGIGIGITTFDLMRCGCRSPEKPSGNFIQQISAIRQPRESPLGHGCRAPLPLFDSVFLESR